MRVEQLYPLPGEEIADALAPTPALTDVVWAQEEPANQGAWPHIALSLPEHLPESVTLRRISRKAAASPAAGSSKVHEAEQAALVTAPSSARSCTSPTGALRSWPSDAARSPWRCLARRAAT